MSMRGEGRGEAPRFVEWDRGLTWLAHPDEGMERASHALVSDGGAWLVDPVDAAGLDEQLADLGGVAGVVLLLDRHRRDAAALAERHDVAVHVPRTLGDAADRLGVRVERFEGALADTGFRARPVVASRFWREVALASGDGATAVVPEGVGTARYYRAGGERVGVHPMLRLRPPRRALGGLSPDRLLVGHGEPVLEDAGPALADALAGARRRAPRAYLGAIRAALGR